MVKRSNAELQGLVLAGALLAALLTWTLVAWYGITRWWPGGAHIANRPEPLLVTLPVILIVTVVAWRVIEQGRRHEQAEATLHERHLQSLQVAYRGLLHSITLMADLRDHDTHGHSMRVQRITSYMARRMHLTRDQQRALHLGSLLHDIGKVGIPDQILRKPGRLTPEERGIMETHVAIGCQILRGTVLEDWVGDVVRHHHERFDGAGYPDGLRGAGIPLVARVFSVADAFDAMTSARPYQAPLTIQQARHEIQRNAGSQFCPQVVANFLTIPVEELQALLDGHGALSPGMKDEDWLEVGLKAAWFQHLGETA